jgi:hypothetical protein
VRHLHEYTILQSTFPPSSGRWSPKPIVRMDLSAIRNAIVADSEELVWWEEKYEEFWEPLKKLKTGLRQFEKKSIKSNDIFENFKSSELIKKVKIILVSIFFTFLIMLNSLQMNKLPLP